jgi:hypothetical protein
VATRAVALPGKGEGNMDSRQSGDKSNFSGDGTISVQEGCRTPYSAIVRPWRIFTVSQYFIRYWLPLLKPSLAWLVIALQQRCYWNREDWCEVKIEKLAEDTGLGRRSIPRMMKSMYFPWFIHKARQYRHHERLRRWVRDKNRYTAFPDDPLAPEHQIGLADILRDVGAVRLDETLQTLANTPEQELRVLLEKRADVAIGPPPNLPEGTVKAVAEHILSMPVGDEMHRCCDALQNRITHLGGPYVGTQYFRLKWVPILGPALAWLIVVLRNSCYYNRQTGEKRDECTWTKRDLAAALGQTTRHIFGRLVGSEHAHTFFQEIASGARRVTYRVVMWQEEEPMTPADLGPVKKQLPGLVVALRYQERCWSAVEWCSSSLDRPRGVPD